MTLYQLVKLYSICIIFSCMTQLPEHVGANENISLEDMRSISE